MSENEAKETMQDFEAELEASFRKINEGDILTGTVISVDEDAITLDLKYYAPGIIKADEVSNDPSFVIDEHIHPGDVLEATVIRRDDGEGNILLSMKEANEVLAWDKLKELLENETVVTVKVIEAVKAGVVAYLYGIRGFIPASPAFCFSSCDSCCPASMLWQRTLGMCTICAACSLHLKSISKFSAPSYCGLNHPDCSIISFLTAQNRPI